MAGDPIWLLEMDALDGSDVATTLRFSSAEYPRQAYQWSARIKQPGLFKTKALGSVVPGSGKSGYGETVLNNNDGGLNYLADYAVDGRAATIYLMDSEYTRRTVLRGTVEALIFDNTDVSVRMRDPYKRLDVSHPQSVYGGTNVLPAGVDGVSSDIAGKNIPRCYGAPRNVAPILVNTSRYIYQACDRSTSSIISVFDRGVALTADTPYASLSDLQAAEGTPDPGYYRAYQGYFRVGSTPTGQVTADVNSTTLQLGAVFSLIASEAGFTVSDTDVAALTTTVAIFLTSVRNTSDLLTLLADSCGGYWAVDSTGVLRFGQLLAPSSPSLTLTDSSVRKVTRTAVGAGPNGLPYKKVTLNADPVETVQTDLAAVVSAARVARLASRFRSSVQVASALQIARHPLAMELMIDTALRFTTSGTTQSTRLRDLFAVRRDSVTVEASMTSDLAASMTIGTVVTLQTNKLGYNLSPRTMTILGYQLDARSGRVSVDLWG